MSIFVGNLAYSAEQQDLDRLFREYGRIVRISLPMNYKLNRPRGFAFMEMESPVQEEKAIEALNGMELKGRPLSVAQARSDKEHASKPTRQKWHRCIPFYRRPLFQDERRFFE